MTKRLLLLDVYTDAASEPIAAALGVPGFTHMLRAELEDRWQGEIEAAIVDAAVRDIDDDALRDADGVVFSGSPFGANDEVTEVTRISDWLQTCADLGKPIFGICFGLQLAAKLAGGRVAKNPLGLETAVARKIELTDAGRAHPMMAVRSASFDAVCDHVDNIVELPPGAATLASNRMSKVQAATIPLGNAEVWGVQYHPDMDIRAIELLLDYRRDLLIKQGFVSGPEQLATLSTNVRQVIDDPYNEKAAWSLGYDRDVLDPDHRLAELECWLKHCVL